MKKKCLAVILAAAVAMSFVACAHGEEDTGSASAGSSDTAVSIADSSEAPEEEEPEEAASSAQEEPVESESVEEVEEEEEEMKEVGMPNPWTETTDLAEAISATGITFEPPIEAALPEGYSFFQYMYTNDTIDAMYEGADDELVIRVSTGLSGDELAGDYNPYSVNWEESLKGVEVDCRGDGEKINVATFDSGDIHWAILCNLGREGKGITIDQVNSLIMGMQAIAAE